MKTPTLLLLLLIALVAVFAALNWDVFVAPTELSLGFTKVQLPLGLTLLVLLALVLAATLLYVVYLQAGALLETRRSTRELRASRELAEQAEASRLTELRSAVEEGLRHQTALHEATRTELLARVDRLEQALRELAEQQGNSLAAAVGEVDDRLARLQEPPAAR